MKSEIQTLQANNTWTEVDLLVGKKVISSKWVYKIKPKVDDCLERYKARLVIRGNTQRERLIILKHSLLLWRWRTTIHTIIVLAAHKHWNIFQLAINNDFLHDDLYEELYMKMQEGMSNPQNTVCKSQNSLYGLKKASRKWFAKLITFVHQQGSTQYKNDYFLLLKFFRSQITIVASYVDDILVTGSNIDDINTLK